MDDLQITFSITQLIYQEVSFLLKKTDPYFNLSNC